MADEVSGARFAEQADSGMLKSERDDFVKGDQNAVCRCALECN